MWEKSKQRDVTKINAQGTTKLNNPPINSLKQKYQELI